MPDSPQIGTAARSVATDDKPPAIILGGTANALCVARALAPEGIEVYALNDARSHVRFSRHATLIQLPAGDVQQNWLDWLAGEGARRFPGAVLLPCSDDGLEVVARHRARLAPHYCLPEVDPEILLRVLDKASLHQIAEEAGIPAPKVRAFSSRSELEKIIGQVPYPCALKPRHSHLFQRHFPNRKMFVVETEEALLERFALIEPLGLEMILIEMIPGADDLLCSYYSYLDENLQPAFHFTKRKVRQYPIGTGLGSYHVTDWDEEVAELGLRFLQGAGLKGIGNPEFKRDPRDGALKLIECNCRFTGCQELLSMSGLDMPLWVYNRQSGRPLPPIGEYRRDVSAIIPISDYLAFRALNRRGELSFAAWLKSLLRRPHLLYFKWSDPLPATIHTLWIARDFILKRVRRLLRIGKTESARPPAGTESPQSPIDKQ